MRMLKNAGCVHPLHGTRMVPRELSGVPVGVRVAQECMRVGVTGVVCVKRTGISRHV